MLVIRVRNRCARTRSGSATRARKSISTELSCSSYELDVSAKVYRIAEMTVALDAGFASLMRSYSPRQPSSTSPLCAGNTHMQLRQV